MSFDKAGNPGYDEFGNYTAFDDGIMGPLTMKGFLAKWTEVAVVYARIALREFYARGIQSAPTLYINHVRAVFSGYAERFDVMQSMLVDMTRSDLTDMGRMIGLVYGNDSDFAYIYNKFCEVLGDGELWSASGMGYENLSDERLRGLLFDE